MTLTKAQIVKVVNSHLNLPEHRCTELIETLLEIMKCSLESGEDILISGFGKFCVREKRARRGRNPATGEDLMLDKRKVITFKCSHLLREKINS